MAASLFRVLAPMVILLNSGGLTEAKSFRAAPQDLGEAILTAMDEVLGCGTRRVDAAHLTEIREAVRPMWQTMPAEDGRLDWRALRYVAHRYFMQRSGLVIKGFEPSRVVAEGESGAAKILSEAVPQHTDLLLGGSHARSGFSLDEAASFLAALEQLVFDSEAQLLHQVYDLYDIDVMQLYSFKRTRTIIESYMVKWMLHDDPKAAYILLRNRTLREKSFPHWFAIKGFVEGSIKTMNFQRVQTPKGTFGQSLLEGMYTFDDIHEVVGGITQNFQHFWESECAAMKSQLVGMDKYSTGRVRLSDFYGTGLEKDWRFGESEQYLRELGVLDESSPWRGKQVIISNYLQAASNCIVSSSHYLVCCLNECEPLLGELEEGVQAPYATPERILELMANMSSPSSEQPPKLEGALTEQLHKIAAASHGTVPLHGRLFAQFMHYAFPRECSFPHKAGSFESHTLTPNAYGNYIANKEDMRALADTRDGEADTGREADVEELHMWSDEEELFASYDAGTGGGKKCVALLVLTAICGYLLKVTGIIGGAAKDSVFGGRSNGLPMYASAQSHSV